MLFHAGQEPKPAVAAVRKLAFKKEGLLDHQLIASVVPCWTGARRAEAESGSQTCFEEGGAAESQIDCVCWPLA